MGPLCRGKRHDDENENKSSSKDGGGKVDLGTFMAQTDNKLNKEIGRAENKPDVELGSLATNDFGKSNMTTVEGGGTLGTSPRNRRAGRNPNQLTHAEKQR